MKNKFLLAAVAAAALGLTACGGGGGGGGGSSTSSSGAVSVTPSLGKFSAGTVVVLKKPDGTVLKTGALNTDGSVSMDLGTYTGPVIVEVQGAAGVTYYDEGTNSQKPFGVGEVLRAALPAPMATVGVSSLTSAAVAKLEAAGGLSGINSASIKTANLQMATAFGLPDILAVPVAVGSTSANLDVGTEGGKYALVLAALAKSATGGQNALDIAKAIAEDLKDGKLDRLNGSTPVTGSPTAATIAASYQTAATTFANASSQTAVAAAPLVVKEDVTTVAAVTNQSDVTLAKSMFAELRTTLKSFSNGNKTGFLDTQATKASDEAKTVLGPDMTRLSNRVSALSNDITEFYNLKHPTPANNTYGYVTGTSDVDGSTPALVKVDGTMQSNWDGVASIKKCYTDSGSGLATKLVCVHASRDAWDHVTGGTHTFSYLKLEIVGNASNAYTYTATRYKKEASSISGGVPDWVSPGDGTMVGTAAAGTASRTATGDTVTQFAISGTLPSSNSGTGPDTVSLNFTRALQSGSTYRYTFAASTSTPNAADATKVAKVALETGSYVDLNEADANSTKAVAINMVGTFQTLATKFTGTLVMGGFVADASGQQQNVPTSMAFTGSIADITNGGAGTFLTGKLELTTTGYASYNSTLPQSASNYIKPTVTFTGTLKATDRPELKLVVAAVRTSYTVNSTTINYTYGTKSFTGSGTGTSDGSAASTGSIVNQDGITYTVSTGKLTKNGSDLATVSGSTINYVDGTSESL